jgi:predicted GH43/DUF377 family glycosyl hydrolase
VKWRKLGRLWTPRGDLPWARTHAMLPTPMVLPNGRLRLFVASADKHIVSRVGWIDLDGRDPRRILGMASRPALDIGSSGMFDDNGVNPCHIVPMGDGSVRLYYVGYQLQRQVPYSLFAGLAIGTDEGEQFTRYQETPVLERGPGETLFRTACFVQADQDRLWRVWYIGGGEFHQTEGRMQPRYSLRHASSHDGITWPSTGQTLLSPEGDEIGFGRPWIMPDSSHGWRMWYSIRSPSGYRLGTAVSKDQLVWLRQDDNVGIAPSPGEWDGEMICYAAIMDIGGNRYMFYNGNGYGRTGVGLAVLEDG